MRYVVEYLEGMLGWALLTLLVYIPLRALWLRRKAKREGQFRFRFLRELGLLLFTLCYVAVLSQTVLSDLSTFSLSNVGSRINLIPGLVFADAKESAFGLLICLLGNLAVLMPIGFLMPLLWKKANFPGTLLFCALTSLGYELLQLPLAYRFTDIDDLWLNTLGGAVGCALALLLLRLFPRLREIFNDTP